MYRSIVVAALLLWTAGCSTLGISVSPPQNLFTEQVQAVIDRSPRRALLPRELDMNVLPAHYLQPGDVLIVEPVDLESAVRFPADQTVLADGTIDLSGFGRVVVAGLTLEQAEVLVERTIVDGGAETTQVNVRLLDPVHRIYVLGEVASPGSYPFSGNETVLDGILAAGGLTTRANPCKVVLARPTPPTSCRVALPICYREITQLGDTTTNYQLQPGDRIFVASRTFLEDLHFWNANQTCDRCCDCQSACADPNVANFANPISPNLPAPPPLPGHVPPSNTGASANGELHDQPDWMRDRDSGEELPLPDIRRVAPPMPSSGSPTRPLGEGQLDFDPPFSQP
ncbi:MAG: polysaccharide biosynthesis/export family protein [Planctomycetaceae bacterium]